MTLMPVHTEILVSSLSAREVVRRLDTVTKDVYNQEVGEFQPLKKFNGKVNKSSFHLSLGVEGGDTFLPLIHGNIDPTANGSILFLKYTLFPGAIFFLYFWIFVTLLIGLFFLAIQKDIIFAITSFCAGAGNLAFAWVHFQRKVKVSQLIFREMLSLQSKG